MIALVLIPSLPKAEIEGNLEVSVHSLVLFLIGSEMYLSEAETSTKPMNRGKKIAPKIILNKK